MNNKITIGELFNQSISNIKMSYKEILTLICIVQLPFLVVIGGITGVFSFLSYTDLQRKLEPAIIVLFIFMAVVSVIYYVVFWIANGAVIKILNEASNYNYITWKEGLQYSWSNKKDIILLNLFIGLFVFIGGLVLAIIALLVTLVTCGIGLILVIPFYILLAALMVPVINVYVSTMVIKDLTVMDSVRETNKLFRKDNFKNIGVKFLIIGGCYTLGSGAAAVVGLIPILGTIIVSLFGVCAMVFVMSCNNVIVRDELVYNEDNEINF